MGYNVMIIDNEPSKKIDFRDRLHKKTTVFEQSDTDLLPNSYLSILDFLCPFWLFPSP